MLCRDKGVKPDSGNPGYGLRLIPKGKSVEQEKRISVYTVCKTDKRKSRNLWDLHRPFNVMALSVLSFFVGREMERRSKN